MSSPHPESVDALKNIIREADRSYVEVGVSRGKTLVGVANTFTNLEKIYGIDAYVPYQDTMVGHNEVLPKMMELIKKQAFNNINNCLYRDKIKMIVDTSENAINSFEDNSIDVVFIDTVIDTKEFIDQVHGWYKKVKNNGILCGHDWYIPYVKKVVIEILKDINYAHRYKTSLNSIWYINK